MSLNKSYPSKEALAQHIVDKYSLPEGVTYKGIDQYNRLVFDFNIKMKSIDVSALSEILGKTNFIDRYYQSNSHRAES